MTKMFAPLHRDDAWVLEWIRVVSVRSGYSSNYTIETERTFSCSWRAT